MRGASSHLQQPLPQQAGAEGRPRLIEQPQQAAVHAAVELVAEQVKVAARGAVQRLRYKRVLEYLSRYGSR